jgi:hypothetical protein
MRLTYLHNPNVDIIARTNYEAYAEIVLLTPEQIAKESRALNAPEVIERLTPEAVPPDKARKAI